MGELQPIHWIVVLIVVLMVFGAGKLPNVLADLGKGIHSFRREARPRVDTAPTPARSEPPKGS